MQDVHIDGIILSFNISWYCWLRKSLKMLAVCKELVTSFQFTNKMGNSGTFLSLTKVLSIDHYVITDLDGLDNLANKRR